MKFLKVSNNLVKLKFNTKSIKNYRHLPNLLDSISNRNFKTQINLFNHNIFGKSNQTRSYSSYSTKKSNNESELPSSDDNQTSEFNMDKENFIKILKLHGDKSNNLLNLIKKCKDDLHSLSSRSYPFNRYNVRALLELLSGLLSIHGNKSDINLLSNLLESQVQNNKFTQGLELCKLFSSYNDSISKRPSPILTQLANKGMMMLARFFVPDFMQCIGEKNLNGVKFAFNSLADSINNQNFEILESCCDRSLFNLIKSGMDFLNTYGMKINLDIKVVNQLIMDRFYLSIGGVRTDALRGLLLANNVPVNKVPLGERSSEHNFSAERYPEIILNALERGAILRMEVMVFSNQTLSILDENNETVWKDKNPYSSHRLCFESEFKLSKEYQPGKKLEFETGDWTLVDINGALNNNNPF